MRKVDRDNTSWLSTTIAEVGWIDVERFGARANDDAFLLVQHSGDLPLMLAVRPLIEAELTTGKRDARAYALLYDRSQMRLGHPQRYGTQLVGDLEGELYLFPLEDPDHVEELRAAIKLFSLEMYLDLIEKQMGRVVRRKSGMAK